MKKEISARRIIVYDFIRGVLMFGVTLGHVISALIHTSDLIPWFCVFVRSYDMPLFAMISGIFLRISLDKKEWWRVMLNKITTILYPAFFMGINLWNYKKGHSIWNFMLVLICFILFIGNNMLVGWPGKKHQVATCHDDTSFNYGTLYARYLSHCPFIDTYNLWLLS